MSQVKTETNSDKAYNNIDIVKDSDNKTANDGASNENFSSVMVQIKRPINDPPTSDSIIMDVDSLLIEETQTPSTDNASQELFSAESSDF